MNTVILTRFPTTGDLTHTASSYLLSYQPDFTEILDRVDNSTDNKEVWTSTVATTAGTKVYGRYKRHYSNGEDSGWKDVNVYSARSDNVILSSGTTEIDVPIVDVKIENDILEIKHSKFKAISSSHLNTTYIVTSLTGEILVKEIESTEHKLSLSVPLSSLDLRNIEELIVYVIHNGSHYLQSVAGKENVTLSEPSPIAVENVLSNVRPYRDITLHITGLEGVTDVEVDLKGNKDVSVNIDFNDGVNEAVIKKEMLEKSTLYILTIKGRKEGKVISSSFTLTTTSDNDSLRLNENFKYQNKLDSTVNGPGLKGFGLSTITGFNRINFIAINPDDNKGWIYKLTNDVIEKVGLVPGLLFPAGTIDGFFRVLHDGTLLVDTIDTDGKAKFSIFKFDKPTYGTVLLGTVVRSLETQHVGKSGSIVTEFGNGYVYYTTTATTDESVKFFRLNLNNGNKTEFSLPEITYTGKSSLSYFNSDKMLAMFGSSPTLWVYDLSKRQWSKSFTIPTEVDRNVLKLVSLKNGDVLGLPDAESHDAGPYKYLYISQTGVEVREAVIPDSPTGLHGTISMPDGSVVFTDNNNNVKGFKFY